MRKLNLTATLIAAAALLAGGAFAQDFDPITDADILGYPADVTAFASRYDASRPGPWSDAELGDMTYDPAYRAELVDASFDPLLDADILGDSGYDPAGAGVVADAVCSVDCGMDCGNDCAAHCGSTCGTH